jgi:hypothetical protein
MITSIIGLVKDCCQGIHPVPQADDLKNIVSLQFQSLSTVERWALIQKIDREFSQKTSEPQQVALFKKALCLSSTEGWKNHLLETQYEVKIDLSHQFLQYSNSLKNPLKIKNRLLFFSNQQICSAIGSSFATNKPERLDKTGHHILDSLFACNCPEVNGSGFALALADGAGGHLGDLNQDERIARASHLGTKTSARIFSAYRTPEELFNQLPAIVTLIAAEIKRQTEGEGTTLVACRAFPVDTGFRVVGFNIGDGMLIAWHPSTKTVYPLFSAHVSEAGTAFLPDAYRPFEVQTIDIFLPTGSLLFLMSDGIHDHLAFTEEERKYPNNLSYRIRTLTNLESVLGGISPKAPLDVYLKTIVQSCMTAAENERKQKNKPDIQMGDDLSILQCYLK